MTEGESEGKTMDPVIERNTVKQRIKKTHGWVLVVTSALTVALSLLLWFHPRLGYADPGSIIAGADLRSDLVQILCWTYGCAAVVSTLILYTIGPKILVPVLRYAIAYVAGVGAAALLLPVLDKFY